MLQQTQVTCVRQAAGVVAARVSRAADSCLAAGVSFCVDRHILGVWVAAEAEVAAGTGRQLQPISRRPS